MDQENYKAQAAKVQSLNIEKARNECIATYGHSVLNNASKPIIDKITEALYCPPYWDNIACWPRTASNTEAVMPCPPYINGFPPSMNATRKCLENGTWYIHETFNLTWTNYTQCMANNETVVTVDVPSENNATTLVERYLGVVKTISRTGYSLSFLTLIVALIIMISFKKLHCPRNKLHMHLFTSFMLRAFLSILKDMLFIDGIGLPSDFTYQNGNAYFYIDKEENNWHCKLLTSLWQYFITANYSWLLMEGLYLHNLIFRALFADSTRNILIYIGLGWTLPTLVVGPWIHMRVKTEDTFCWTKSDNLIPKLIIKIPIMISILINLVLFIKISVVLYTKLQSPINYEQARRYQKWAKSTLVLVPLFGIHYSVLVIMSFTIQNEVVEVIWVTTDQLFASFQGFVVAVLYCFLNGEVKAELQPHVHAFLTYLASSTVFKYCFPCREKYLSSARGRTSVCTTMSCSSLYTNGLHHQKNSRTKWELFARSKHSISSDKNMDHVCHPRVRSWQDVSRSNGRQPSRCNSNGFFKSNQPYNFSSNANIMAQEVSFCHTLGQERCQSEPHLIEEEMMMIPKSHC